MKDMFFSVRFFFSPGVSLQDFFPLEISLQDNFFLKSSIIPPPPPLRQKGNGRPLKLNRKQYLLLVMLFLINLALNVYVGYKRWRPFSNERGILRHLYDVVFLASCNFLLVVLL